MLIDLAIAHCAYAGCETIWIVVNESVEPFLKKRVGDYVVDPYSVNNFSKTSYRNDKLIPIYYVPEDLVDRHKRDSISYQVIRGIEMARRVSGQISSFTIPKQYFVTFPYSVYDYEAPAKHKVLLSSKENVTFECVGKSIATGHYVPFTITHRQAKQCKKWVWMNATGVRDMTQPKEEWQFGSIPTKMLPSSEQYNGRFFGPDKVFFERLQLESKKVELPWFHDVCEFEGYKEYMGSGHKFKALSRDFFMNKRWNSMSFDDDEFEDEDEN